MMLPDLPVRTAAERIPQESFGGLDRRKGARDGAIAEMLNLWADDLPVLSSRATRYTGAAWAAGGSANGIFSDGDHLFVASGTTLYVDGVSAGTVANTKKVFTALGNRVLIWPDKKMWTEADGLTSLEAAYTGSCTFKNGVTEDAIPGNTIAGLTDTEHFAAGDKVSIQVTGDATNNKASITILKVVEDEKFIFAANSFVPDDTARTVTITNLKEETRVLTETSGEGDTTETTEVFHYTVTGSFTFEDEPVEVLDEGNTLEGPAGLDFSAIFSKGDAVKIEVSGAESDPNNKPAAIIREIDGNKLIFYVNTFTPGDTAKTVTITRQVPDLDFLCSNDNRAWGCKDDTIWSCKLGDPTNWYVFDGIASDAWSVDTGTAGAFTGCISFLGYPTFFKEDAIFKVYGTKPANYELMRSSATGVLTGAGRTLAIVRDSLYYLSRAGFVAYAGGMPAPVGQALGDRDYTGGAAGSDGKKYYVSARYGQSTELLVFDPDKKMWVREDETEILSMAWCAGLYGELGSGNARLSTLGRFPAAPEGFAQEGTITSQITFAPWGYTRFRGKYPVRLWIRYTATGTLTAEISYDFGAWQTVAQGTPDGDYLPVPIRRCDSWRLRLTATGTFSLYAIEQEYVTERTART